MRRSNSRAGEFAQARINGPAILSLQWVMATVDDRLTRGQLNGTRGMTKHVILCHVSRRQISISWARFYTHVYEIFLV